MFTPEEKQQLEHLEATCAVVVETTIRQHDGGYVVTHIKRFVLEGLIKGQIADTFVAATEGAVTDVIDKIYALSSVAKIQKDDAPSTH